MGLFASLYGGTNQQTSGSNTGLIVAMVLILTSFVRNLLKVVLQRHSLL